MRLGSEDTQRLEHDLGIRGGEHLLYFSLIHGTPPLDVDEKALDPSRVALIRSITRCAQPFFNHHTGLCSEVRAFHLQESMTTTRSSTYRSRSSAIQLSPPRLSWKRTVVSSGP